MVPGKEEIIGVPDFEQETGELFFRGGAQAVKGVGEKRAVDQSHRNHWQ